MERANYLLMAPRPDLEDWFFAQLEKGKSVAEVEAEAGSAGWGDYDMWRDWALDGAIARYHKKHGKSDELKRAEFLYYAFIVLLAVFLMVYFSRPRF
jgi:hypothetical protein